MSKWQRLSSEYVHENPYYKIRHDTVIRPDGKTGQYYVSEGGRSVLILPLTKEGGVLFVNVLRYPTGIASWEVPAGGVEDGEDILVAAKRELQEETGYRADSWKHLGVVQLYNSKSDALADVYLASQLTDLGKHDRGEEGITDCTVFDRETIMNMIGQGQITDVSTLAPLMLAIATGRL